MTPATDSPAAGRPRIRVVLVLAALGLVLALSGPVDRLGETYIDAGLQRALATFALARGLNAAISVAQGTELAVQPAGVGLVLAPGQILDPVNDLIERFSWVMLVAGASLGVQKLLLQLAASWVFTGLLLCAWLLLAVFYWRRTSGAWTPWAQRLLVALLVLRFAVPAVALINQGLHELLLDEEYREAEASLESTTSRLGDLQVADMAPVDPDEGGLVEGARRWYQSALAGLDIGARLRAYEAAAAGAVESALRLIALFVLQTILLPLAFLWGMLRLGRWLGRLS